MRKLLMTVALLAAVSLSACDNADDVATTEPAAGDAMMMAAPEEAATVTTTETTTTTTETTTVPAEPVVVPEETAPAAEGVAVGEPNPTSCGDHSALVGKNIADIDQTSFTNPVRVLAPDTAATMDFNPERINIILDAEGGVVTEVRCG